MPNSVNAQEVRPVGRILERSVRLTLDETGDYRVIDAMRVLIALGDSSMGAGPVALFLLPEEASAVRGLGGDIAPRQIVRDGPRLVIVGTLPGPEVEVAATYRLPRTAASLVLQAVAPVDELAVYVDRGRIHVRPDGTLRREADEGPRSRPSRRYVARDLESNQSVRLAFVSRRLGWRERLVVVLASILAAAWVGARAWRAPRRQA